VGASLWFNEGDGIGVSIWRAGARTLDGHPSRLSLTVSTLFFGGATFTMTARLIFLSKAYTQILVTI
jgi:hypothetical protein